MSHGGFQKMTSMELGGLESPSASRGWMTRIFSEKKDPHPYTDFLNFLDRPGEPSSHQEFNEVLKALRRSLQSEIRRRGLQEASPSVLGLVGYQRWTMGPGHGGMAQGEQDALMELTTDCYVYIFIDRLRSLRAQLKVKENVDGLVLRNVRNFVHDAQKRHDPLGFRVFQVFRRAVEMSIKERNLFLLNDHQRLHNETLLGFYPEAKVLDQDEDASDLTAIVARWNDTLLSEIVTARGAGIRSVIEKFKTHLLALKGEGVIRFRCRQVVEPLKADARSRWATLWSHGDGSNLVGDEDRNPQYDVSTVGREADAKQRFMVLSQCVENSLKGYEGQERTRRHLLKFWDYLKDFAISDVDGENGEVAWEAFRESLPSHRELHRQLGIPRERFPDLYETIKRATQGCLGTSVSRPVLRGILESPPGAVRRSVMEDRRDELLQQTKEALRRLQEEEAGELGAPMRLGKLYSLAESSDLGVEWLALDVGKNGCWHMVPADPHPWLGSSDWELRGEGLGPLTLRCAEDHWLDARVFNDAIETAILDEPQLQALGGHLRDLGSATSRASDAQLEADEDPEYLEWCQRLREVGQTLACRRMPEVSSGGSSRGVSRAQGASLGGVRSRSLGDGFLARAAVVFLAVGLAHWSGRWIQAQGSSGSMGSGSQAWALIHGGQVRSGVDEVVIPVGVDWLGLLIDLPSLQDGDRLEISRADGNVDRKVVWQDDKIAVNDNAERNLVFVSSEALPNGDYVLRVLRDEKGQSEEIFVRELKVVDS